MLTLFPDEKILTQSVEGNVTLTSHRIVYESKEWGRSYNQSIMLEHITSCENLYNTHIWLLILAVILFAYGMLYGLNGRSDAMGAGLLISIMIFTIYWITRKNLVVIASPSTKMYIKVLGMKRERVLEFINKVEQAKHQRILTMNNKDN